MYLSPPCKKCISSEGAPAVESPDGFPPVLSVYDSATKQLFPVKGSQRVANSLSITPIAGTRLLAPVRLSKRSKYVKFTDDMEHALSAMRHLDKLTTPLVLSYGTYETPEFQRQTRDFAAAVRIAGNPVELLVGEGYNHFEMLETLANPYGLLGRAALAQMHLLPP